MKDDSKLGRLNCPERSVGEPAQKADFRCPGCGAPLDIDGMLSIYGPEGLYELSDILREIADEDVRDSMGQEYL